MIRLTDQQHQAIQVDGDKPVRAFDPATNQEYVLIKADVFDRLQSLFAKNADWSDQAYSASMEVFARDGWDDAQMNIYDSAPSGDQK